MYQSRGKFGAGSARYQSVDLSSRLEGATPHQLVQVMYEELLKALDAMAFATARGDYVQRGQRQSKALAILTGLETSLDFEKGGEIAAGLVVAGGRESEARHVTAAREMILEISTAWDAIGQRG